MTYRGWDLLTKPGGPVPVCSDDVMAVDLLTIEPIWVLDPQQAVSNWYLDFQNPAGSCPDPLHGFSNQQAAEYQPEGCPQADNMPRVVISHAGQHTFYFFVMTLWTHFHTNYKITTALADLSA